MVDLPLTTQEEIVNIGRDLFFQSGSSVFADVEDMDFGLAAFHHTEIEEDAEFTLQKYIDQYKRKLVKMFITSKKKNPPKFSISDCSDSEFEHSA